jgi:hypothetical protein
MVQRYIVKAGHVLKSWWVPFSSLRPMFLARCCSAQTLTTLARHLPAGLELASWPWALSVCPRKPESHNGVPCRGFLSLTQGRPSYSRGKCRCYGPPFFLFCCAPPLSCTPFSRPALLPQLLTTRAAVGLQLTVKCAPPVAHR